MIDPLYSISGFAVGLLVGMTGVGGGSLMTPLLILLFGVHPATAVGTDLLYAAATKTAGSCVHGLARSIDWVMVRRLATGSIPATIVTLAALSFLNLNSTAARSLITVVLCFALFLTAGVLIFRRNILDYYQGRFPTLDPRKTALATVLVGAVLGILVSISSVGAGAIGVMALVILYPRMPMARIVGSDIAHAVPLTLIAGMGHWMFGAVDWQIMSSLLVGSLPGIFVGSYLTTRVPESALRIILATTLLVVASKLAYDHVNNSADLLTAFTRRAPD
ncbi:MAG TPA: sulfite exporter TauE/SafE family protein [Pseudolabrys sp.]|nr:sulfite exporter TauE/SafE family protein [Pseudolabrys sp.]